MDSVALDLSADLRDELAENERVDPATARLRFSHLKAMGKSAAHCLHAMQSNWEPTLAMRIGTGAHSLILGGPELVVYPGKVRNGKNWDAFKADNADKIILSRKEHAQAHAINAAVRANPLAQRVLFQPETVYERTIEFEWMGRACRATPDARTHRHLVDLKSTRCAEPEKFRWDAIRMGYHAQMALYVQAMTAEQGFAPKSVYIVAVEQQAPHAVTVLELTSGALQIGERLCRTWMEKFLQCEQSNSWPGYCESVVEFDVPDLELALTFADDDEGDDNNEQEQ